MNEGAVKGADDSNIAITRPFILQRIVGELLMPIYSRSHTKSGSIHTQILSCTINIEVGVYFQRCLRGLMFNISSLSFGARSSRSSSTLMRSPCHANVIPYGLLT